MAKNNSSPQGELSYYGLSLLSYLHDSHPDKTGDKAFITKRSDLAAGFTARQSKTDYHIEAEELASAERIPGLAFFRLQHPCKYTWDEFPVEIPKNSARKVACRFYAMR
jgi:hypothetical protein